jgi:phosphoribosyl 1,2-cyclic phosphate phosphodiesterase
MKLEFLGTGTSQGVPVITCKCEVCKSEDVRDNRLRTSALLYTESAAIAIDAGPDFRFQMLRADVQRLDAVLLTHAHHDHVAGLDDVRAFNYSQKMSMPVYGDKACLEKVSKYYDYAFDEEKYPGVPEIQLMQVDSEPFYVGNEKIIPLQVLHGKLPILGFRINNLAYITDASVIPQQTLQLLDGVEVLVINALRHHPHHSHFSFSQAFEFIKAVQPAKAYLTHISHVAGKHSQLIAQMPAGVEPAYDGFTIEL